MPAITTNDLRSEDFYRQLVIPALYQASVVLRSLRRIDTTATKVNLPDRQRRQHRLGRRGRTAAGRRGQP